MTVTTSAGRQFEYSNDTVLDFYQEYKGKWVLQAVLPNEGRITIGTCNTSSELCETIRCLASGCSYGMPAFTVGVDFW